MKRAISILLVCIIAFGVLEQLKKRVSYDELSYSQFVHSISNGAISDVKFQDGIIFAQTKEGSAVRVIQPSVPDSKLIDQLLENKVEIVGTLPDKTSFIAQLFLSAFPILLIGGIILLLMRNMQSGKGGGPMGFGKSKARMFKPEEVQTTFDDVAGIEEAKEDVVELVDFLRNPEKFRHLGGKIPKGILMIGAPGTGKTLLAKSIAGEAKVPFFFISGSDFVEMFVGIGAARVRDMFAQAKKCSPCIIFIDEIDAVGRHRGGGWGGGNDEREQTLNQMLVELDGFEETENVIVLAATNRPDVLDKALLRPGRFDRQIHISLPDKEGREKILLAHLRKIRKDKSVDASVVARGTPGFSGADLANLVNEAALIAVRHKHKKVTAEDFEFARDKLLMGAERRSMVMSKDELVLTAYHEAGHAILGWIMPDHDTIHKVSIIPRGRALGVTQFLPEKDRHSVTKKQLLEQICTLFGGRIAEEIIGGKDNVTTGASNDIQRVTEIARHMVTKWGLTDVLGPIQYVTEPQGYGVQQSQDIDFSAEIKQKIDQEVRRIVDTCYKRAHKLLVENRDILESMKDALIEHETIDYNQVKNLMERKPVSSSADDSADAEENAHESDADSVTT